MSGLEKKHEKTLPLLFHEILFTELRYAALTYTDQLNADCEDIGKRSSIVERRPHRKHIGLLHAILSGNKMGHTLS